MKLVFGWSLLAIFPLMAVERTFHMVLAKVGLSFIESMFSISSKSDLLISGKITRDNPAVLAARTFSLIPPTGSTLPVRLISPVMATSSLTIFLVKRDT